MNIPSRHNTLLIHKRTIASLLQKAVACSLLSEEHHRIRSASTRKDGKVNGYRLFSFIRWFAYSFSYEYVESGLIGSNRLNSGYGHRRVEHALHDAARRQVYHVVRRVLSHSQRHWYSSFQLDLHKIYTESMFRACRRLLALWIGTSTCPDYWYDRVRTLVDMLHIPRRVLAPSALLLRTEKAGVIKLADTPAKALQWTRPVRRVKSTAAK